jgi:hypothetical protein
LQAIRFAVAQPAFRTASKQAPAKTKEDNARSCPPFLTD